MTHQNTQKSKWDKRFFDLCEHIAGWSEDQSRKVGAVIVGEANEILATGYNGLPRGISGEVQARHEREGGEKYFWFEHAERNAIFNAARSGTSIEGSTIYCSLFPCADCVRAIIQSGIKHLKTFAAPGDDPSYSRSFQVSEQMLKESGTTISLFEK